jgi:tetratricopeptide (TPR) repeat protein
MKNMRLIKKGLTIMVLSSVLFGFVALPAQAYYNAVTEYEIALLPDYLQVKVKSFLGMKTPDVINRTQKYSERLGRAAYSPLHHYGLGLIYLMRVQTRLDYPNRSFDLNSATKEFSFVIQHSPKDSFILYEVYYKRGESYVLKGETINAMKDLNQAISLKPDFINAYVMLSECYRRIGDLDNAQAVLETGRSRATQSKTK